MQTQKMKNYLKKEHQTSTCKLGITILMQKIENLEAEFLRRSLKKMHPKEGKGRREIFKSRNVETKIKIVS